jgi:hypothetical protein
MNYLLLSAVDVLVFIQQCEISMLVELVITACATVRKH